MGEPDAKALLERPAPRLVLVNWRPNFPAQFRMVWWVTMMPLPAQPARIDPSIAAKPDKSLRTCRAKHASPISPR
jgi:hypothetical protein